MKLSELRTIQKLYFGYEEIAKVFGISAGSAKVTASRYVRQGLLVRVRKNLYVVREVWNAADRVTKFTLANLVQSPSYISLMTALDFYGITTQMQRDFFESVAMKRTKELHVDGSVFRYSKITGSLYFGFQKEKQFFIATPEKALLDALYLMSYGRYALDIAALDIEKFDPNEIKHLVIEFPLKTRNLVKKYGYL
jgi:predicted transcriptional regulator of viral defense system